MGNKRENLLRRKGSKILCPESMEGEMMFELVQKADELFAKIRNMAGHKGSLDVGEAEEIIRRFQGTILKTSEMLSIISDNIEIPYREPLLISEIRNKRASK